MSKCICGATIFRHDSESSRYNARQAIAHRADQHQHEADPEVHHASLGHPSPEAVYYSYLNLSLGPYA